MKFCSVIGLLLMNFAINAAPPAEKQVIVLGAGIIGVTSAYYLAEEGYNVTVVERHEGVGQESSFANGAQLCYSCIYPLNPTRNEALPQELTAYRNQLFRQSANEFNGLLQKRQLSFPFQKSGILQLFFTKNDFGEAKRLAKYKSSHGIALTILSPQECIDRQPLLQFSKRELLGGILMHHDAIGDAFLFTKALAEISQGLGVKFLFKTEIEKFIFDGNKIDGLITKKNATLKANVYVASFGVNSKPFLEPLGIDLAMKCVKGYSISIELDAGDKVPDIGIADPGGEIFYAKLGKYFRVAGLTEEVGMDTSLDPAKVAILIDAVDKLFPQLKVLEKDRAGRINKWACLRPSAENKVPFITRTKYKNLLLNTGHGGYGWTLAPASARLVVDLVRQNGSVD